MRQTIKKDSETPDLNPSKSFQDALPGALLSPCHMDPVSQVGIFVFYAIKGSDGVLCSKATNVGIAWICIADTNKHNKCWQAVKNGDKFAIIFKKSNFILSPNLLDKMISAGPRYDCSGFGYYFQELEDGYHAIPGNTPYKISNNLDNESHDITYRAEDGYIKDS